MSLRVEQVISASEANTPFTAHRVSSVSVFSGKWRLGQVAFPWQGELRKLAVQADRRIGDLRFPVFDASAIDGVSCSEGVAAIGYGAGRGDQSVGCSHAPISKAWASSSYWPAVPLSSTGAWRF